jgi:cytoskeletal protein CcmA (bactofilin family)
MSERIKAFGKFRVVGNVDAQELEVWGNMTINGYLYELVHTTLTTDMQTSADAEHRKCKTLTLYGSLTLIGQNSGYMAEDAEKIWGSKIIREDDVDW